MKKLIFEGYSDDTFAELTTDTDYDNCASGEPVSIMISHGEDRMIVRGQYCPDETTGWQISVVRDHEDDDRPLPDWPMWIEQSDRPYSPRLVIEAPQDVRVTLLTK